MHGMERNLGEQLIHVLELVQGDIDATAAEPHRRRSRTAPTGRVDPRALVTMNQRHWSVADTAQDCLIEGTQ
jgi:hypothetical protein